MVELNVLSDNQSTLWENSFDKYREARPFDSDCDVNEERNWLGARACTENWECRGDRTCNKGVKQCTGDDGCGKQTLSDSELDFMTDIK